MSTKPPSPPPVPFVVPPFAGSPRGMISAEAALLSRWLAEHWREYDSVDYNIRVGIGIDPGPQVPDTIRQGAIANSQRRIDALLYTGQQPTIVEVKVRGSLWAIGQLLGYRVLWMRDNPGKLPPRLVMVCGSIDQDTAYAVTTLGLTYEVVTLQ